MEVFSVVFMIDGTVTTVETYENNKIAEEAAVTFGTIHWGEGFLRHLMEKVHSGLSIVELLTAYQEKEEGLRAKVLMIPNEIIALDTSLYPFKYRGIYVTAEELHRALVGDGFTMYEDMDESLFSLSVKRRQNSLFSQEELLRRPIPELYIRYELSYRGGEIEKTIYAVSEEDALAEACEDIHHCEYWTGDEEFEDL